MNSRERVLRTLDLEEPDKVPYQEWDIQNPNTAERLGFQGEVKFEPEKLMSFLGKIKKLPEFINNLLPKLTHHPKLFSPILKYAMPNYFKLHIHLGVDLTQLPVAPVTYFKYIPPNIIVNEFGQIFQIKNIGGVLDAYYVGGFLKNREIYEEFPKMDPEQPLGLIMFKNLERSIKNDEILVAPSILNGLFDSVFQGIGIERFSRALIKDRDFIKKIVADRERAYINIIKNVLDETNSPVFMIGDDLAFNSGPFISPRYFKMIFLPAYKRIAKTIHKRGAKFLFHSDGDIRPLLEDLIPVVDSIHPWQVSANMNIFEAKEKYGDKICIMGNVPVSMLVHESPSTISEYVRKLIKKCAPGGGYMLSSGNSIVPEIPADNYLAMLKTHRKYRDYPLSAN